MHLIKSPFPYFSFLILITLGVFNCSGNASQKEYLVFQNKAIILKLKPEIGGRIASLQYEGVEILSQIKDENNWHWGSTIWPAPQSDWNWPPPEKMDQAPYEIKTHNDEVIILKSQKDAYKNIQVEKRFQFLDDNSLEIKYSFFNWGDTTIRIGIWENTRVPYQGQVRWKTGKRISENTIGLNQVDNISFFDLNDHKEANKLFIESEGGWIEHRREGIVFTKSFEGISKDRIPSSQAQIEVYYDPINKFVELEEHGPYMTLTPRSVATFKVVWKMKRERGN